MSDKKTEFIEVPEGVCLFCPLYLYLAYKREEEDTEVVEDEVVEE
ncbi:MAG: hypothetical protein ACXQT3_03830 [Methermicoccaceae archaeon]